MYTSTKIKCKCRFSNLTKVGYLAILLFFSRNSVAAVTYGYVAGPLAPTGSPSFFADIECDSTPTNPTCFFQPDVLQRPIGMGVDTETSPNTAYGAPVTNLTVIFTIQSRPSLSNLWDPNTIQMISKRIEVRDGANCSAPLVGSVDIPGGRTNFSNGSAMNVSAPVAILPGHTYTYCLVPYPQPVPAGYTAFYEHEGVFADYWGNFDSSLSTGYNPPSAIPAYQVPLLPWQVEILFSAGLLAIGGRAIIRNRKK